MVPQTIKEFTSHVNRNIITIIINDCGSKQNETDSIPRGCVECGWAHDELLKRVDLFNVSISNVKYIIGNPSLQQTLSEKFFIGFDFVYCVTKHEATNYF